jgi:hypothetical protein
MAPSKKTPRKKPRATSKDFKPGRQAKGGFNPPALPPLKWKMM